MVICNKQHRYLPDFNKLPEAQDNRNGGRHICAACAYEEGLHDALHGNPPKTDLSHLPDSPRLELFVIRVLLMHIILVIDMVKKLVLNKSII